MPRHMNENGWFKIWSKIYKGDLGDNFMIRSAFIDLIAMANWRESKTYLNGKCEVIERGQILTSIKELSARWEVTWRTANRWVNYLETTGRVHSRRHNKGTVITIHKYLHYQDNKKGDRRTVGTAEYTARYPSDGIADGIADGISHGTTDCIADGIHIKKDKKVKTDIDGLDGIDGLEGLKNIPTNSRRTPSKKTLDDLPAEDVDLAKKWAEHTCTKFAHIKPDLLKWAKAIGTTRKATKMNAQQMGVVFEFVKEDDFWSGVVQSPLGLTKKSKNGLRKIDNILASLRKTHYSHTEILEYARRCDQGLESQQKGFGF